MGLADQARFKLTPEYNVGALLERLERLPIFPPALFSDPCTDTNTTTTWSTVGGTSAYSFNKQESWTDVLVDLRFGAFSDTVSRIAEFGVQIDGTTNTSVTTLIMNVANAHHQGSGIIRVEYLDPGWHTFQPIYRREASTGACTLSLSDDNVFTLVTEVQPQEVPDS